MADTYDWRRLDEGWRHRATFEGDGVIEHGQYSYGIGSGAVMYGSRVTSDYEHDPDAAYTFHTAAREQVAKCRVDWRDEVKLVAHA